MALPRLPLIFKTYTHKENKETTSLNLFYDLYTPQICKKMEGPKA